MTGLEIIDIKYKQKMYLKLAYSVLPVYDIFTVYTGICRCILSVIYVGI